MLEAKVIELSDQLDRYKHKIHSLACGDEVDFREFYEVSRFLTSLKNTTYFRTDFIKEIKQLNDEDGFERFKQIQELNGVYGKCRVLMIKKLFRTVIETMVPDHLRIRMQKEKNLVLCSEESYNNLFKLSHKAALAELAKPEYSQRDREMFLNGLNLDERAKSIKFGKV